MTEMVRGSGRIRPTFANELLDGRREADVSVTIGLAFRAHRRDLELTQRSYADHRGWSKGQQCRLESHAGGQRLDALVEALVGTGVRLALVREGDLAGPPATEVISPEHWPATEFIARDAAGRRFPAHRDVRRAPYPPDWWMWRYSTSRCDSPEWTTAGWWSVLRKFGLDDPGVSSTQVDDG